MYSITDKKEIKKSLVEVQSIIGKLSQEEYTKIPDNIKLYIENNKEQKEFMNFVYDINDRILENKLKEKYNSNNIFNKK